MPPRAREARDHGVLLQWQVSIPTAAQVLGTFGNGRVERFMEGMRHLDPAEMARRDLVPLIARRLAQFHAVALGDDEDEKPQIFNIINKWCAQCEMRDRRRAELMSHGSARHRLEQTGPVLCRLLPCAACVVA